MITNPLQYGPTREETTATTHVPDDDPKEEEEQEEEQVKSPSRRPALERDPKGHVSQQPGAIQGQRDVGL
jgi:hypothetical protein